MELHLWLTFVGVALAYSLVPGPAFLTILSTTLRHGSAMSFFAVAGVLAGDVIYFVLAAAGLNAILARYDALLITMQYVGAVYLAVLGLRGILGPSASVGFERGADNGQPRGCFNIALVTQLGNPKLLLFLAALVPQFIVPTMASAPQFIILGATFLGCEGVVYGLVAALAVRARTSLLNPRAARIAQIVTSIVMLCAAAHLVTAHPILPK